MQVKKIKGPTIRIGNTINTFEYIPPFTLIDCFGVTAYCCGRCFKKLGDDPFGGRPGKLVAGAPKNSICIFCGKQAWPFQF